MGVGDGLHLSIMQDQEAIDVVQSSSIYIRNASSIHETLNERRKSKRTIERKDEMLTV